MTPQQRQKFNTAFGGVFLGSGIVAWMLALFYAVSPNEPAPAPVIGAPTVNLESCRNALAELDYTATVSGGEVTAFEPLKESPKEQLERASVAATLCKIPMKAFCMGEGCAQPGVTITLRKPIDRSTAKPEAASAATPKSEPAKQ